MPQIEARDLDYSDGMKAYFQDVIDALVNQFNQPPDRARELVNRYFALEVNPLERAFLMHTEAENVAADLAASLD